MARNSFFSVHKKRKKKKRTRLKSSHLDRSSLVNIEFIMWQKDFALLSIVVMARLSGEPGKKANCFFFPTSHQVIAYTSQLRYIEQ